MPEWLYWFFVSKIEWHYFYIVSKRIGYFVDRKKWDGQKELKHLCLCSPYSNAVKVQNPFIDTDCSRINWNILAMAWIVAFVGLQCCICHKRFHTSLYWEAKVQMAVAELTLWIWLQECAFQHGTRNDRHSCHPHVNGNGTSNLWLHWKCMPCCSVYSIKNN